MKKTKLPFLHVFFRVAGVLLGGFCLFNLVGEWLIPGFGIEVATLIFPVNDILVGRIILAPVALALIAGALIPFVRLSLYRSSLLQLLRVSLLSGGLLALFNAWWIHIANGTYHTWPVWPPTFSLAAALVIFMNLWRVQVEARHQAPVDDRLSIPKMLALHVLSGICLLLFIPLIFIINFGFNRTVSFSRITSATPVDCIIVYGAKVKDDGTLSYALAERVQCGASLFHMGLGNYLVMSGGYNGNGISESKTMKQMALSTGIPGDRIIVDEQGIQTFRSALNLKRIMKKRGWTRSISVSHYYHLLRIQLAAHRAGIDTLTFPVSEKHAFRWDFKCLLREVAALYYYYLWQWRSG